MVDRFTVYPGVTYHTGQPHQNIKGEYVLYSDYASLQKELAERTAERDAALSEARADTLARRVGRLEAALEMIAGKRQCIDNLMSNVDIALAALAKEE